MKIFSKTIIALLAVFFALSLIISPDVGLNAGSRALELCLDSVIPSLFPFLVLSGLFIASGAAGIIGRYLSAVMRPLFGVSGAGAAALVLGSVSGYPMGAVCAAALYSDGECTKTEAERLCAFCNNSGPLFIMGVIACGILHIPRAGGLLYISHILSALLTGLCVKLFIGDNALPVKALAALKSAASAVRGTLSSENGKHTSSAAAHRKESSAAPSRKSLRTPPKRSSEASSALTEVIEGSIMTMLKICAYVLLFSVISAYLPDLKCRPFIHSFLEITGGIAELANTNTVPEPLLPLISFFIAFSGVSVIFQVYSIISPCGLSIMPYIFGKLLQGVFSFAITYAFVMCFPETTDVFFASSAELGAMYISPLSVFLTAAFTAVLCVFVLILAAYVGKTFISHKE